MNTFKVVPVLPRHYHELSQFLSTFPNETRASEFWLDRFHLWWDNNPAFSNRLERGWVLCNDAGIEGFLGAIPSTVRFLEKDIIALSMTTWRVNSMHRKDSMKLLMKFVSHAEQGLLFCTTPNFRVRKILSNLGFQLLPRMDPQNTGIITDIERVFSSKLQQYVPSLTRKLLVSGKLNQLYQNAFLKQRKSFYSVKLLTHADHSFDKLWEKTRYQYDMTNVRTSDILNWYCFSSSSHRKILLGCYDSNQLLVGYVVLWEKMRPRRQLECIDLWLDFTDQQVLEELLSATLNYAISNSFEHAVFPHFNKSICNAVSLGINRTKLMKRKDFFKVDDKIERKIFKENSYFTMAQGDVGL